MVQKPKADKGKRAIPNATLSVSKIIDDVSNKMPEFAHVDSSRVLVLLGEARRTSRASVRPMHFADTATRYSSNGDLLRPRVRFKGRNIYYVLTLRPLFFLRGTPQDRIATIIHEMFHFSSMFDGTLHPERRHSVLGSRFADELSPLVERYLRLVSDNLYRSMALNKDIRVRMWLEKPGLYIVREDRDGKKRVHGKQMYTERQTFLSSFVMKTQKEPCILHCISSCDLEG